MVSVNMFVNISTFLKSRLPNLVLEVDKSLVNNSLFNRSHLVIDFAVPSAIKMV